MVFIQPSIVNNDRSLYDVQADMDARYKVSPDARGFADGPGVLPAVGEIPRDAEKGKPAVPAQAALRGNHRETLDPPGAPPLSWRNNGNF